MTLFHEVLHITSDILDHSYYKGVALKFARETPEVARHNTNSYVYFAAENGYTLKDYRRMKGQIMSS